MTTKKVAPPKLPKDFSLYPRANGHYAQKIKGKLHYFGTISDPEAAWAKYLVERDDLQAGRTPNRTDEVRVIRQHRTDFRTDPSSVARSAKR